MSGPVDPATGKALPTDAIQRVLFVCRPVHVYAIPPLTSMKGYVAADWTSPDPRGQSRQIFTGRLRILETAIPAGAGEDQPQQSRSQQQEQVRTDILLEEPETGNLFAAAPYTGPGAVEHATDSSRFFAVRFVGDGRKAMLGIGFEDRSEAFDFGVTLQEARKVLGFDTADPSQAHRGVGAVRGGKGTKMGAQSQKETTAVKKDYSLKPGETITVNIGRKRPDASPAGTDWSPATAAKEDDKALFSIAPPPGSSGAAESDLSSFGTMPLIAPPPSASQSRRDRRSRPNSRVVTDEEKAELGFNDGEFGEFQ